MSVYVYICMCIARHALVYACIFACKYVCTFVDTHSLMSVYMHVHMHGCSLVNVCISVLDMHEFPYKYECIYIHMYTCMSACTHIHEPICMYGYKHKCMNAYIHMMEFFLPEELIMFVHSCFPMVKNENSFHDHLSSTALLTHRALSLGRCSVSRRPE